MAAPASGGRTSRETRTTRHRPEDRPPLLGTPSGSNARRSGPSSVPDQGRPLPRPPGLEESPRGVLVSGALFPASPSFAPSIVVLAHCLRAACKIQGTDPGFCQCGSKSSGDSLVNYLDAALRPIFGPWCFRFAPHVRGSLFGLCGSQLPRRCPGTSPSGMLVLVWFLSCDGKAGLCDEWSGWTRFAVAQVRA